MKFGDNFDLAYNLLVEFCQVFGWYPIFLVDCTAYLVDFVAVQKLAAYVEAGDVTCIAVAGVPVAGYLGCVLLVENWIEDWLPEEPGRECCISAFLYECELF